MTFKSTLVAAVVTVLLVALAQSAGAFRRIAMAPNQPGAGGMINLPYQLPDQAGTTWMVYQGGWLQHQGNTPMFSQAAVININQNQPNQPNNQAKLDPKTGEVVLENLPCANVTVTRRIKIDVQAGVARYIDIIKNTQNAEQTVNVMLQTNTNYGVNSASVMNDPKRKNNNIAWIAQTSGNRTVVEMFSGRAPSRSSPSTTSPVTPR